MKLPKGWRFSAVDDFVADLEAGVSVIGEDCPAAVGEFGVLKVSAVSNGRFLPEQNKRVTGAELGADAEIAGGASTSARMILEKKKPTHSLCRTTKMLWTSGVTSTQQV